jgi:serine/threonine protein kinase/tetratricopeptide (TPR) repeat protein
VEAEAWKKVEELFWAAQAQPPDKCGEFLKLACADDFQILAEVQSLLDAARSANSFLEGSPVSSLPPDRRILSPGQTLQGFEVLELIGTGGMGEVYRARDLTLKREVAIKVLIRTGLQGDENARNSLIEEARAISALGHPHVVTLYSIEQAGDFAFLVMEYIDGETLSHRLRRGPMPFSQVLEMGIQVADALAVAHARGIVHRDIKPGNIMITSRGAAKVLDFGLSTYMAGLGVSALDTPLTGSASKVAGTLPYMSPEQVRGETLDGRSDVFSLAVVLYEAATASLPYGDPSVSSADAGYGTAPKEKQTRWSWRRCASVLCASCWKDLREIITARQRPSGVNPDIPSQFDVVLERALAKDREKRYSLVSEFVEALESLRSFVPSKAPRATDRNSHNFLVETSAWLKRHHYWRAAVFGTLLLIAFSSITLRHRFSTRVRANGIAAIAVLPFENLPGDASQEYLADGVTDGITADLGRLSALKVISSSAVIKYKRHREPLASIARALKVDGFVEGTLQRSGKNVRITARLIKPEMDRPIWSAKYEGDLSNAQTLHSNLARDIAKTIGIRLAPEQGAVESAATICPEAYDYYLRGKFLERRNRQANSFAAIDMLRRAIKADPSFGAAYSALASAYAHRSFFVSPQDGKLLEEEAYIASEKAASLAPNLAQTYLVRALLLWTPANHFPHERAAQQAQRAVNLNPNLEEAHSELAMIYNHIGLLDRALQEARTASAINPDSASSVFQIGHALLFQGHYEQALRVYRGMPDDDALPEAVGSDTAWALSFLGRGDEARKLIQRCLKGYPADPGGMLTGIEALLFAQAGDKRNARRAIAKASQKVDYGHFHHAAYWIACAYAQMKQVTEAVDWLQKASENGFPCYPLFLQDPNLNPLRRDARFIQYMDALRKQWEYFGGKL